MAKFWRTLRTHPKKSLLFAGFTFYIYGYLEKKYTQDVLRRKFCSLVKPLGNVTVSPTDQLRRLTVFLNPFARRGNLLKDFEKNVAPILQLSGLDVQMVYTDNDTEIKDFVTVLDPTSTDGILIASDDHVLQKVCLLFTLHSSRRYPPCYNARIGNHADFPVCFVGVLVCDCSPVIQRDMAKFWRTLRTHPKKSLLFAGFTFYIYGYLEKKYTQDVLRRKFCSLVKPLGNVTVSPTDQLRRLTVFLNPFARRGNLLKDFEKNVAPILQLSGLDVQMVYTDNDTEIKDFVTVLDPTSTDGILIASDDHVLQKVCLLFTLHSSRRYPPCYNARIGKLPGLLTYLSV
ncbi:hypothetical protein AHF37_09378 [Paragonimus kellicotti]|nr:hypothetical protein AHF37_09378 [Paragonimus kellicotti]